MSVFRYDWGNTVRIASKAPVQFRPGSLAAICGMRTAATQATNAEGTPTQQEYALYLVEFGDGHTVEIPQDFLEPEEDKPIKLES